MEYWIWLKGGGLNGRSLVVPLAAAVYITGGNSIPAGNLI